MPFSATISLTSAGTDAVLFDLYSNVDSYVVPFETSIPKASMLAGYTSTNVPTGTNVCRVTANCGTSVDIPISDPFIYVYEKCGVGGDYYKIGLSSLHAQDTTAHCYMNIDSGFLSAMTIAYPSLAENNNLTTSSCACG